MLSGCSFFLQQICIFLPHAFFCLKMLFFAPLHFSASSLRFFHLQLFFTASKPSKEHLDSLRFTCVSILSIFWIFSLAKSWRSSVLFFTVPRIARSLNFVKSGKIDCYSKTSLFPISLQVFQKSKSLNFSKSA